MMGFFLLVAAGNDSTKATYCSGMRALMEDPEQRRLLLEDPSLVPDAVEESLRMFPAFAHFRRTATCDTELHGQKIKEGEKVVMWYVVLQSRRDAATRTPTASTCAAKPSIRRSARADGTSAWAPRSRVWSCKVLIEETLARYPDIAIDGAPAYRRVALHQPAEGAARSASARASPAEHRAPAAAPLARGGRRAARSDQRRSGGDGALPGDALARRERSADRAHRGVLRGARLRPVGGRAPRGRRARGLRRARAGRTPRCRSRRPSRSAGAWGARSGGAGIAAEAARAAIDYAFGPLGLLLARLVHRRAQRALAAADGASRDEPRPGRGLPAPRAGARRSARAARPLPARARASRSGPERRRPARERRRRGVSARSARTPTRRRCR